MKKNLFFAAFALLATCMTFSLTACGDDDDDDDKGGAKKVTLNEYGYFTDGVLVYDKYDNDGAVYVMGFAENAKVPSALKIPAKIKYQGLDYTVVAIGNGAFEVNSSYKVGLKITSVSLPNTLEWIGSYAFYNCEYLKSISFPDALISIYPWAFANCEELENVDLNKVEFIGEAAFKECVSFTRINIPATVKEIQPLALSGCDGVKEIVVDKNDPYYDSRNNCNAIIKTSGNILHTACQTTVIPNDITTIGDYAYYESEMTSFTIPSQITKIGEGAFSNCDHITSFVLHENISKIGSVAFAYCNNLTDIYCLRPIASLYNADKNAFNPLGYDAKTIDMTLHVKYGTENSYKPIEPWKRFAAIKKDVE